MTEKSLSLHDGAAAATAADPETANVTVDEQLPSYGEAVNAPDPIDSAATRGNDAATGQQQLDLIRPMKKNRPCMQATFGILSVANGTVVGTQLAPSVETRTLPRRSTSHRTHRQHRSP